MRRSRLTLNSDPYQAIPPCHHTEEAHGRENRDASIPVVVPIIIAIIIVPMMVAVPAVPPIFARVSIVAVSVVTIVIGPDLFVSRAYVNSESIICFGFGGR
jgi:hypothetical protein